MSEKTRKITVICLLPLAVIWAIYNISGNSKEVAIDQQELNPAMGNQVAQKNSLDPELVKKYDKLDWGSDPFFKGTVRQRTKFSQKTQQSWHLAGILFNNNNPHAVINNIIVKKGDSLDGAEVLEINKDRVILTKNGAQFTLSISKDGS